MSTLLGAHPYFLPINTVFCNFGTFPPSLYSIDKDGDERTLNGFQPSHGLLPVLLATFFPHSSHNTMVNRLPRIRRILNVMIIGTLLVAK